MLRLGSSARMGRRHISSTIDADEVRKFANLNWHAEGGGNNDAARELKKMHLTRLEALKEVLRGSTRLNALTLGRVDGFTALDVGCGGGLMATSLKGELGAKRVLGIDASESGIRSARERSLKDSLDIEYKNISPEQLDPSKEKFDLVCALEVVEHVSDRDAFIKSCADLCRGVLVVSTMNRTLASWTLAIAAAEHVAGLVPKGTHDWRKFVNVEEIEEAVVHRRGMNVFHTEEIVKLIYNPISASWSYAKNVNESVYPMCNYMYFASV